MPPRSCAIPVDLLIRPFIVDRSPGPVRRGVARTLELMRASACPSVLGSARHQDGRAARRGMAAQSCHAGAGGSVRSDLGLWPPRNHATLSKAAGAPVPVRGLMPNTGYLIASARLWTAPASLHPFDEALPDVTPAAARRRTVSMIDWVIAAMKTTDICVGRDAGGSCRSFRSTPDRFRRPGRGHPSACIHHCSDAKLERLVRCGGVVAMGATTRSADPVVSDNRR